MSLNDGFYSLCAQRWSEGYRLGDVVHADLERSIEVGKEILRRGGWRGPFDPRGRRLAARAARYVADRQLVELGCHDLGGEG